MNQYNKKQLALFLLPVLCISTSNFAMLTKCASKIKKSHNFTTVESVNREIESIKNNVYKEYIQEIKYLTNDPHSDWDKEISTRRNFIKEALQNKNPYETERHNTKLPAHMYKDIITTMHQENINPAIIKLQYNTTSKDPNLYGGAYSGTLFPFTTTYIINPFIIIYQALASKEKPDQLFTYNHELQHIILGHSAVRLLLPYSKNLISLQEREADLHAASKNIDLAFAGMKYCCLGYNGSIINHKQHKEEMTALYILMQIKQLLSKNNSD